MNKIKYIIAEDRQEHIEALQKAIQKTPYNADLYMSDILECVAVCIDGLETWAALQQHQDVQILFLDYQMPEMSGKSILELLKNQANPPIVVLVTAYSDTAMDLMTFYSNIAAPILKPVTPQRFKAAMEKVMIVIKPPLRVYYTSERKRAERLVLTNDIVCIESLNKKIIFSFVNQSFKSYEKLESNSDYHTLTKLIDELPANDFYRVNHSYIVNRQHIKGVSVTDVEMKDGTLIGIPHQGVYNREAFLKWYQQK